MPNRVSRLRRSSCWGKAWLLGMTLYWWGYAPQQQQQQQHFGVLAFVSNPSRLVHSQATVVSYPNAPRTFFPASTPRRVCQHLPHGQQKQHQQSTTQLHFMGSDGGVLGIGTPELVRSVGTRWKSTSDRTGLHSLRFMHNWWFCKCASFLPSYQIFSFPSLLFCWWDILSWDRRICTNS